MSAAILPDRILALLQDDAAEMQKPSVDNRDQSYFFADAARELLNECAQELRRLTECERAPSEIGDVCAHCGTLLRENEPHDAAQCRDFAVAALHARDGHVRQQVEALEKFCAIAERDAEEIARLKRQQVVLEEAHNEACRTANDFRALIPQINGKREAAEARLKVARTALVMWTAGHSSEELTRSMESDNGSPLCRAVQAIAAIDAAPSEDP